MFHHTLKIPDPILRAWRWLVLLALLGVPLACDDDSPTAPKTRLPTHMETSLQSQFLNLISLPVFDASPYYQIDYERAARAQWGPSAFAVQDPSVGDHLYCWRAQVGNSLYPLDLRRAVAEQFGPGYVLGAVNITCPSWRAVHWSALTHEVLPVMVIASDYFFNVDAVIGAMANFQATLGSIQAWYGSALAAGSGRTPGYILSSLHMLQPLVVFNQSSYTAAQWNAFSAQGSSAPFYDGGTTLADMGWNAYQTAYPPNDLGGSDGKAVRVLISVFTGNSPTVDGGTGWLPDMVGFTNVRAAFAVVPPIVTSLGCPWGTGGSGLNPTPGADSPCQESTYLVAHELGYSFGLQSCAAYDLACLRNTIMGFAEPPYATLSSAQAAATQTSGFFYVYY
jgi:hypothetical protein